MALIININLPQTSSVVTGTCTGDSGGPVTTINTKVNCIVTIPSREIVYERIYVRKYTQKLESGYCVQVALNTSFPLLLQLAIWGHLCLCFDSKGSC